MKNISLMRSCKTGRTCGGRILREEKNREAFYQIKLNSVKI